MREQFGYHSRMRCVRRSFMGLKQLHKGVEGVEYVREIGGTE